MESIKLSDKFEQSKYWQKRVISNSDISVVGHHSFSIYYNSYIYRRRLNTLSSFISSLEVDPLEYNILDVGCGSGFYTDFWKSLNAKKYTGIDISDNAVNTLKSAFNNDNKFQFRNFDISEMNIINKINDRFDIITIFDVFYHITDDRKFNKAVDNISNLINPGGYIIVFDQLTTSDYSLLPHVKYRNRRDYFKKFNEYGLILVYRKTLFQFLVHPLFGIKPLDLIIAGSYKCLGLATRNSKILSKAIGKALLELDRLLLRNGCQLPNNEMFCFRKKPDNDQLPVDTTGHFPQGLVSIENYQQCLASPLFSAIEAYSDNFLRKNSLRLKGFAKKWVPDSLHQWSRQWEYAYTFTEILAHACNTNNQPQILDAGSGISFFPFFVSESCKTSQVTCCDSDSLLAEAYAKISPKTEGSVKFISTDICSTGMDENSFDIIYCISVLEHTKNFPKIIKEFFRLLKDNGILIVTFDISLDGYGEISPDKLINLTTELDKYFQSTIPGNIINFFTETQLCRSDIISTEYIASVYPELLPWKYPFLSLAKSALAKKKIPLKRMKSITFSCHTLRKQSTHTEQHNDIKFTV